MCPMERQDEWTTMCPMAPQEQQCALWNDICRFMGNDSTLDNEWTTMCPMAPQEQQCALWNDNAFFFSGQGMF